MEVTNKKENGKIALVTGSTAGIGREIAKTLAKEGYGVIINGRRPHSDVKDLLEELKRVGSRKDHSYLRGSIADEEVRLNLRNEVGDRYGRLDVLVNNAGIAPEVRKDMLDLTEKDLSELMRINLHAPFLLTSLLVPLLKEGQRDSYIINISSISAYAASVNRAEYCISKAGISMMTILFARRLVEEGIRVFEIRPGIIRTDMTAPVTQKYDQLIEEGLLPIKRWGIPEDIAKTVSGIVRGYHPYATGNVINVDGGFHIRSL